ncbi:MAG TPA: hypothetical protein VFI96_09185 [Longimicrobiaceae bacterium]|nr:hypothetical protein [Longimicrobiaceae bacterium]
MNRTAIRGVLAKLVGRAAAAEKRSDLMALMTELDGYVDELETLTRGEA